MKTPLVVLSLSLLVSLSATAGVRPESLPVIPSVRSWRPADGVCIVAPFKGGPELNYETSVSGNDRETFRIIWRESFPSSTSRRAIMV